MSTRRPRNLERRARGFTSTELVLVLLMTVVIVVVAISAYETYSVRGQVSAAIVGTQNLRTAIAELYRRERRIAGDADTGPGQESLGAAGRFVSSVHVVDARLDLTFGGAADAAIAGRRLSLTPYETVDLEVVWICGNRIPGPGLQPLGFAAGGPLAVQLATSLEARFLPPSCR